MSTAGQDVQSYQLVRKDDSPFVCILYCGEVLSHVEKAVCIAGYTADVAEGGQKSVQPKTTTQAAVFHIRLTQLGVGLPVR